MIVLDEVLDLIREQLTGLQLPDGKSVWATILAQILRQNSFEGQHAETILELIRRYLKLLDDQAIFALYRQTETGMTDTAHDDQLFADSCRVDLEVELLREVTNLAWAEARKPQ